MTRNFASLYKTSKKEGSSVLKLKCDWISDELNILVIDGNTAWSGKFSAEEVETFCEGLGITRDDYITECQQAFSGEAAENFLFSIEKNRFVWRKAVEADIKVKFGSISLSSVPLIQALQEFADFAFETLVLYRNEATEAKKKTGYFETERTILVKKLEEYAQKKEEVENILYSKFLHVLNAKKKRIAILEQEISDLTSKIQPSITETEKQECDKIDVAEHMLKAGSSSKTTRETRKSDKKTYQHKVRQSPHSVAVDNKLQVGTTSVNSDTQTTQSSTSKDLKQKQNVRRKGHQRVKNNPSENATTSSKKEDSDQCTSKLSVEQSCETDVLEHSRSIQYHFSCKNDTEQQKIQNIGGTSSVASTSASVLSLKNHAPVKHQTADPFVLDEQSKFTPCQPQSDEEEPYLQKRPENTLASEQIKDITGSIYGPESQYKTVHKIPEVICPIDLVSQKINAQSDVVLNNVNKITSSKSSKKVVTSPTKQYRNFEVISPLDMLLQPKTHTPSVASKGTAYMPESNPLETPVESVNVQHNSSPGFSGDGINVYQEADSRSGYDFADDVNTDVKIKNANDTFITVPSVDNTKNQTEVETNHYDSETDVDEPEDSCKLSAKHRAVSSILEESDHYSCPVRKTSHFECDVAQQQGQKNDIENLLNDSQNTDDASQEIPMAALPKRIRRSDRINKCVPLNTKSINHFARLNRPQEKSQNVSREGHSFLYEQETQLVDTQKLLDELG